MPYKDKEKQRQCVKQYQVDHADALLAYAARYRRGNPKKVAFWHQKDEARGRGISWELTQNEWIEWWSDDFRFRGNGGDSLCMCRYGDTGPYALGNIYKATRRENLRGPRF